MIGCIEGSASLRRLCRIAYGRPHMRIGKYRAYDTVGINLVGTYYTTERPEQPIIVYKDE